MRIVEVEVTEKGNRERVVAELDSTHGMVEFNAQVICKALNKHVNENSKRYFKVVAGESPEAKKDAA